MITKKNRKTYRVNREISKNTSKKYKGGKVIASGGFGCIFKPVLKCKSAIKRETDKISKLMVVKDAKEEYEDIMKFKPELEQIPNYENYFLIDGVNMCIPDKLTKQDLSQFNKKCKALKKEGYTEENINGRLKRIRALNMPDGGIDVGDFIEENDKNMEKWESLNETLVDLLLNGIIPMNKHDIYHADVKGSNILVDELGADVRLGLGHGQGLGERLGLVARLIDWGLSVKYDGGKTIPKAMTRRPFQYNLPFSIVLFNDTFTKMYNEFLKKNPDPSYHDIRVFVINYVLVWHKKRGPGHSKYIKQMMKILFHNELKLPDLAMDMEELIKLDFLHYYVNKYLADVLFTFTKNGKFQRLEYFQNVYLKNIDVWGFVLSYFPMMVLLNKKRKKWGSHEKQLFKKLKHIIVHYLFETPVKPIDVESLAKDLKSLHNSFTNSSPSHSFSLDASFSKDKTSKNIGSASRKRSYNKTNKNSKNSKTT